MAGIVVNASTSLVLIDTNTLLDKAIVYLSSLNTPGSFVTIRDSTGNANISSIVVSTTKDVGFLDGPQVSSYQITQPYGFLSFGPKTASTWTLLNSFAFPSQTAASISNINVSTAIIDKIYTNSFVSTANLVTSTQTITNSLYFTKGGNFIPLSNYGAGLGVNDIFYVDGMGLVGVGTSNPSAPLDVPVQTLMSSLFISSIGIGTSNPAFPLDIDARVRMTSIFTSSINVYGLHTAEGSFTSSIGINVPSPLYPFDVNAIGRITSTFTSSLAIATTNPQALLDVRGTGAILSTQMSSLVIGSPYQASFPVHIGVPTRISSLTASTLAVGTTATTFPIDFQVPTRITSTFVSSLAIGTLSPGYALDVAATARFTSTLMSSLLLGTTTGSAFPMDVQVLSRFQSTFLSSLALGTTTPAFPMDVRAIGRITSTLTSSLLVGTNTASAFPVDIQTLARIQSTFTSSLAIGTTTPQFPLDVNGNARVTGSLITGNFITASNTASTLTGSTLTSMISPLTPFAIDSFLDVQNRNTSNVWVSIGYTGSSNTLINYSLNNGLTWTTGSNFGVSGSFFGQAVGYNGSRFLAAATNSTSNAANIFISDDGINWSNPTLSGSYPNQYIKTFLWTGTQWLALGGSATSSNTIARSSDGINWTGAGTASLFTGGLAAATNGRRIVAVGKNSVASGTLRYSDDGGTTWTACSGATFTAGTTMDWAGVATNGLIWVATGYGDTAVNTIKYSFDGITFSNVATNGFNGFGADVRWNGEIFVAVGSDSGGNTIKTSRDGISWTNASSGMFASAGYRVRWNGRVFIAGGDGTGQATTKYSLNGTTWVNATSGALPATYDLAYSSNVFPSLKANNLSILGDNQVSFVNSTNTIMLGPSSMRLNYLMSIGNPTFGSSNVGIGTMTPQYTLDVNGAVRFGNTSTNNPSSFMVRLGLESPVDSSRAAYIFGDGRNMQINNQQSGNFEIATSNTARFTILSNGNVGISTITPEATLDVIGASINAATVLESQNNNFMIGTGKGTGDINFFMGTYKTDGYSYMQSVNRGNFTAPILMNPRGGRVGIGTTSPTDILDVNGVLALRGGTASSTYNSDSQTYIAFGSNGALSDFVTLRQIGGANQIALAYDFHDDIGDVRFVLRENANANGRAPWEVLRIDNGGGRSLATFTQFSTSATTADAALSVNNSAGAHSINFFTNMGAGNYNSITQSGDKGIIFTNGSADTGNLVIAPWASGTKGIRIQTNGNVGIGTASPSYTLDVFGNAQFGTDTNKRIQLSSNEVRLQGLGTAHFSIFNESSQFQIRNTSAGGGLGFLGTAMMAINTSGQVGIGTTSPSQTLDVNGTIRGNRSIVQVVTNEIDGSSYYNTRWIWHNVLSLSFTPKQSGNVKVIVQCSYSANITNGTNEDGLWASIWVNEVEGNRFATYNQIDQTAIYYRNDAYSLPAGCHYILTMSGTTTFSLRFYQTTDDTWRVGSRYISVTELSQT